MRQPERDLVALTGAAGELRPAAFDRQVHEWRRGGFPSSSIPNGTRSSARSALPTRDGFDRYLDHLRRDHANALRAARQAVATAHRIEAAVLGITREVEPREYHACANASAGCTNYHARTNGACDRCRQWRKRHGTNWPTRANA